MPFDIFRTAYLESTTFNVSVADLSVFIDSQDDWHEVPSKNNRLRVFVGPLDDLDCPIRLVLPTHDNFGDTDLRLNEAVCLLASIGDCSPQQVVDSILSHVGLS